MKLQSLRKQYENTQMSDGEVVVEFFSRLVLLTNQMISYGEKITNLQKVENVLRSLTAKLNNTIVVVDELNDLIEMNFKELQTSFKTHELRLK